MILTYRYRLLPSKRQHRRLEEILESQRQLYNAALEERIDAYRKSGIKRTYIDQTKGLTEWRQSDAEGRALPANLQRATLKRVDAAFNGFLSHAKSGKKGGFPRFRGKGRYKSFGFRQFSGIMLQGTRLRFRSMPGGLRVHLHRAMPEGTLIRSCDFRRDTEGWSISFAVDLPTESARGSGRAVGIDLGLSRLATLSDGVVIPSLKPALEAEGQIRRAQRSVSRKLRGSRGRQKARLALGRCYARLVRQRTNHVHQATAQLVRHYDVIAIEALNVQGLASGPFAKHVRDVAWGKFISMLEYKAERAGIRLIKVDPRGTTQTCSSCGQKVSKALSERQHDCPSCGLSIDRDLNAARNILHRAGVGPGLHNVADRACVQAEISAHEPSHSHQFKINVLHKASGKVENRYYWRTGEHREVDFRSNPQLRPGRVPVLSELVYATRGCCSN